MHFDEEFMIWSDSFKEGEWAIHLLTSRKMFTEKKREYRYNFQPVYYLEDTKGKVIRFVVYGGYSAWKNQPDIIKKFLEISRPDIMIYCPKNHKLILAIEETAAVPTGNQSLQRLDRMWWAAELGIPFIYLIPEYGVHKDKQLRRNSIWPAYLGIKLSSQYGVPSFVLLFGNKDHPEDYVYGDGMGLLSEFMCFHLLNELYGKSKDDLKEVNKKILLGMGSFIISNKERIAHTLPGTNIIATDEFARYIGEEIA